MDFEIALRRLTSKELSEAQSAFDWLQEHSRERVGRTLRRDVTNSHEREDVLQEAFVRCWRNRGGFAPRGEAAWFGYLNLLSRRIWLDRVRGTHRERLSLHSEGEDGAQEWEVPDAERTTVEQVLEALETERIDALADVALLRMPGELCPEQVNRRLLAAQLYYLDGVPLEEIPACLTCPPVGEPPLTEDTLQEWLLDSPTLLKLCYTGLYRDGRSLAAEILGLGSEVSGAALTELERNIRSDGPVSGWSVDEIRFVLWRYRWGLSVHEIQFRKDCNLSAPEIEALGVRCAARVPFESVMGILLERFGRQRKRVRETIRSALEGPELWQRLAFTYSYRDGLSQRDVFERIAVAAEMAGRPLTPTALNAWLSGNRLGKRLLTALLRDQDSEGP